MEPAEREAEGRPGLKSCVAGLGAPGTWRNDRAEAMKSLRPEGLSYRLAGVKYGGGAAMRDSYFPDIEWSAIRRGARERRILTGKGSAQP